MDGEGTRRMPSSAAPVARARWPAYAAAGWALVFALRGVYWALGGTIGVTTLSPEIQRLAAEGDRTLFAALWVAVALLLGGTLLALALVRPWGRVLPRGVPLVGGRPLPPWLLVLPAAGAGGLLLVHGGSYASLLLRADTAQPAVRWYGLLWGPWFMLGGALFILAANAFRRRVLPGRPGVGLLVAAVAGGCMVAAAPQLLALLVGA